MGDPDAPPLHAAELFQLFDVHRVRYIVVGGLAATVHGSARVTFDVDVVPEWSDDNLERLAAALRAAGADARSLREFEISTWRTRLGDVDVIVGTPTSHRGPLAGYEALLSRAHRREIFGLSILVADLEDVIESKQALARESDLVALPELRRLRDRLARQPDLLDPPSS